MIQATQTGPATLSFNGKVVGVAHKLEYAPNEGRQTIYFSPDYAKTGHARAIAAFRNRHRVTLAQERRRLARRRQGRS